MIGAIFMKLGRAPAMMSSRSIKKVARNQGQEGQEVSGSHAH
jgi:hypothetical protein